MMSSRLSDRLDAARRQNFVGRSGELAAIQSAFNADHLPFNVMHVFGPGGVGKTSLLRRFADLCAERGVSTFYLDGRNIEPNPGLFQEAMRQALGLENGVSALDHLAVYSGRCVVQVDTYESLAPLDDWLRSEYLPGLPDNTLFIMAGRNPPAPSWRTDPGWQDLVMILPLRNLAPEESRSFLARRRIPTEQHQAVMEFTHGHPLALSLIADVFAQRPGFTFVPEDTPDIVKTLVEQFIQKAPGPAHRAALEACSLVRLTSEALLARMLGFLDVHELFDWLRSLSFIDSRRGGIFPHDLAREALIADLRWRNPDWYAELHSRARGFYVEHLSATSGAEQQRVLWDFIYLHRDNPVVRPYFEWQASGSVLADAFLPDDREHVLSMVQKHEGEASAKLASFWLDRFPMQVLVFRDNQGTPVGFYNWIELNHLAGADLELDPAIQQAWAYLRNTAPLRPGETATIFRYWMADDGYQSVSPIQSLIFVNLVRYYLTTRGLAYIFIPCAQPEFWEPVFTYGDLHRLDGADFTLGDRTYGMFGHDWRVRPPMAWLDLLAEREISASPQAPAVTPASESVVVLSHEDFGSALWDLLRDFTQPAQMHGNPLLRSRLAVSEAANASETERIQKLRDNVLLAAESLKSSPRSEKYFRALDRTYFHPAPTQEIAAELLDLPFSTYRRHLKSGIDAVTEILWRQEIGR